MALLAETLSTKRLVRHKLREVEAAHSELRRGCELDSRLRAGVRNRNGEYRWLKTWWEEWVPAWRFALQQRFPLDATLQLSELGKSGADFSLCNGADVVQLEITLAHSDWAAEDLPSEVRDPGYQDALRIEKMMADGFVSTSTPLIRDKATGEIRYWTEEIAKPVEANVAAWAKGLQLSLDRKCLREGYGSGATLVVYGEGLSGDFTTINEGTTIGDVVQRLELEPPLAEFDRVYIVGWDLGWLWKAWPK